MENPAQEIAHIVRSLTMGNPQQQQDAVETYFLTDASFSHPFCRVPSFPKGVIPFAPCTDSRSLILAMYRYYRTLSPRIQLSVESSVFDQSSGLLYLYIHQIFSLWFLPFHKADVHLTTVLHLVQRESSESEHASFDKCALVKRTRTRVQTQKGKQKEKESQQKGQDKTQPEGQKQPPEEETATATATATATERQPSSAASASLGEQQQPLKYYIASQQDLYQVTDSLKFIAPLFVSIFVFFLQLLSALLCVVGSVLLRPLYHYLNDVPDREIER